MKRPVSTRVHVLLAGVVSILAGCGGGGSGGGYMAPMMPMTPMTPTSTPAPTVSPSLTAASINYGQAVTLKWTSANATACTATASAAAGGTFSGSQAVSGSLSVIPTAPGTYTYSVSCSGTGGTKAVSTPTLTVNPNILATLVPSGKIPTIGSTVDPMNGDQNPYGLTIAPATQGLITKGDLVVCNFNNGNTGPTPNTQGAGTTIIGLHPTAGATPYRIARSADLTGCEALAMLPDDSIAAAAWTQNQNPLVAATGVVATPFSDTFANPWGEAYAAAATGRLAAIYVSNAPGGATNSAAGTIDRISLDVDAQTSFTEIATGFCTSGVPGAIFGPGGLTYDPASDTLYVIDTSSASVVAIAGVSSIAKDGVLVNGQCSGTSTPTPAPTFSGPSMSSARVIAHGAPFNTPLSSALLGNGDLLVGNADIGLSTPSSTTNLLIEVSPVLPGGFVGKPLQVDSGTPGALFGIAATINAGGQQIIYFNDDNASAVMQLVPAATSTPTTPYAMGP
jgi:hypothetical protein